LRYTSLVSRLRRPFLADRLFFVTCNLLRARTNLMGREFAVLARVFESVRQRRNFLLGGYVFMPDHWHALHSPAPGDTLPRLMGALKIAANRAINVERNTTGKFWQLRYFDRAMRTVKEHHDALRYMHFNPVARGLVQRHEEWPWSSIHSFGGPGPVRLAVDVLNLPADERTRL
jgi:putative transposase